MVPPGFVVAAALLDSAARTIRERPALFLLRKRWVETWVEAAAAVDEPER